MVIHIFAVWCMSAGKKKDRNLKKRTVLLCQVLVTQKNTSLFCFFFSFENSFTVSVCFEYIPGLTGCFKIIFVHQLYIFLVDFKVIIFRKCDLPWSRISKKSCTCHEQILNHINNTESTSFSEWCSSYKNFNFHW